MSEYGNRVRFLSENSSKEGKRTMITLMRVSMALIWNLKSTWNNWSITVRLNVGSICCFSSSMNSGRGVVKFHFRTCRNKNHLTHVNVSNNKLGGGKCNTMF